MATRVGINGFGRIGRNIMRAAQGEGEIEIVAVNDITDATTLAHLLKYDSVLGNLSDTVAVGGDGIQMGDHRFRVIAERDPANLPWGAMAVDVVLESTGLFTKRDDAAKHLAAGAKRVIITAPATQPDLTLVLGVNHDRYDPAAHRIISNASCTTNCLAPVAKVLHEQFGLARGWMTTVHSYTNDQKLLDPTPQGPAPGPVGRSLHDPDHHRRGGRRRRSAPQLKGKLNGISIRVPTPNVSVVDLVAQLNTQTTAEAVNAAFTAAADGPLRGVLQVTTDPLVSIDFKGNRHSSIVDASYTSVMDGDFIKVLSWYDNEWGYSSRCVDLVKFLADKGL